MRITKNDKTSLIDRTNSSSPPKTERYPKEGYSLFHLLSTVWEAIKNFFIHLFSSPQDKRNEPYQRLIEKKSELKGFTKFKALLADDQLSEPREFIIPQRRICNVGGMESHYTIMMSENTEFIKNEEILTIHPLRFLRNSPFATIDQRSLLTYSELPDDHFIWETTFKTLLEKQLYAIAITKTGKHVILQQAIKSCVPTCVAMLLLDHGKKPNYELSQTVNLADDKEALQWIKEGRLVPKITFLTEKTKIIDTLLKCLKQDGPGILSICHPLIDGHAIILDEISIQDKTATIRDSAHGWMLTMKLKPLISWIEKDPSPYFIQIDAKRNAKKMKE